MIDAAIVGLGRWGKTLVEAVQGKSERLRFTHTASRDPDKLRNFAEKQQLELVSELEPRWPIAEIDAVVLATRHLLHRKQIIAATRSGSTSKPSPTRPPGARPIQSR